MRPDGADPAMLKSRFTVLSDFRLGLAGFLRFSERAAIKAGLTPTQYLLLLHLRGFPGQDWATVGQLAQRLLASHQATVALVKRCAKRQLVVKHRSKVDARRVEIHLTANGRRVVDRVAVQHRNELTRLRKALEQATGPASRARRIADAR